MYRSVLGLVLSITTIVLGNSACSKSDSGGGGGDGGGGGISAPGQAAGAPQILLENAPLGLSNARTLAVKVSGVSTGNAAAASYRFGILTDSTDCTSASYSDAQPIDVLITADAGADGAKRLCVLARSESGVEMTNAATADWLKDTVAPKALITGLPSGVKADKAIQATITGELDANGKDQLVQFAYAIVAGEECTSLTAATFFAATTTLSSSITDLADGAVSVCVAGKDEAGNIQDPPTRVSWTKDTTAPEVTFTLESTGLGLDATIGDKTTFTGTADDATSDVVTVEVSLKKDGDSAACLNKEKTGFVAACPNWLAVDSGTENWQISLDDSLFAHNKNYELATRATDTASNTAEPVTDSFTWDEIAPSLNYIELVATAKAEQIELSWDAASDVLGYIVVRKAGSAPSFAPTGGVQYVTDDEPEEDEVIAYAGPSTNFVDDGLIPDQVYHYVLYAFDAAYNYSEAVATTGTPFASFFGLSRAYVAGPLHWLGAEWQIFADNVNDTKDFVYSVYSATTSGGHDFVTALATATNNVIKTLFTGAGSGEDSEYVVVRTAVDDEDSGENVREQELSFAPGTHHKITSPVYPSAASALASNSIRSYGLALDAWGNQIFSQNEANIAVRCQETTHAPYCRGRKKDYVYVIIGADGEGDGGDGVLASAPIDYVLAIATDRKGNIFFADNVQRIRVMCNYIGTSGGFCAGKERGLVYHVAGTGSAAYPTDGGVASETGFATVTGLAVDAYGNLAVAAYGNNLVLAICNSAEGRMCNGKTAGNMYHIAGDGSGDDGADGMVADADGVGSPSDVAFDSDGNIFIADPDMRRLRLLCLSNASACSGREAGKVYRLAGDGTASDGGDGAATSAIGSPFGLSADQWGNVYFSDSTNYRTRVLCLDVSDATGFCQGKTEGYVYVLSGTGSAGTGTGGPANLLAHGYIYGIDADAKGNVFANDWSNGVIRALCYDDSATSYCNERAEGDAYLLTGYSTSASNITTTQPAYYSRFAGINGVVSDSANNLYIVDSDYHYYTSYPSTFGIYALCYDVTTTGTYCTGKTEGNIYRMLTGTTTAPPNGTAFTSALIRQPSALAVDAYDNIFVTENYYYNGNAIYALCINVTGGYCAGKSSGNVYRMVGNGSTGVTLPGDNVLAVGAVQVPEVHAMAFDSYHNLIFASAYDYRIRVVCVDATANAINTCSGLTVGNTYYLAGTGSSADGADDTAGTSAAHSSVYGLDLDQYNNVFFTDTSYRRLRVLCKNTSGGYCAGKTSGRVYRVAGTGSGGDGADAGAIGSTASGTLYGITLDESGNAFVVDDTYSRIRVICLNTTSGYCASKSANTVYRWTGTGSSANGRSNQLVSSSTATIGGNNYGNAITFDASGDIIYGDGDFHLLRWYKGY